MDYAGFDSGMDLGTEGFSDMGFADAGFNGGPGAGDMGGFGMDALLGAIAMQVGGLGWQGGDPEDEIIVTGEKKSDGVSILVLDWLERFFDNTLDSILAQIEQTQQSPEIEDMENYTQDLLNELSEAFEELGYDPYSLPPESDVETSTSNEDSTAEEETEAEEECDFAGEPSRYDLSRRLDDIDGQNHSTDFGAQRSAAAGSALLDALLGCYDADR